MISEISAAVAKSLIVSLAKRAARTFFERMKRIDEMRDALYGHREERKAKQLEYDLSVALGANLTGPVAQTLSEEREETMLLR